MWYGLVRVKISSPGRLTVYLGKSYDEGKTWIAYRMWIADDNDVLQPWNFGNMRPIYELNYTEPVKQTGFGDWTDIFQKYSIDFIYKN